MSSKPTRFHWLRLRAVTHPTEDAAKVRQAVAFVAGIDSPLDLVAREPDEPTPRGSYWTAEELQTHHGLTQTMVEYHLEGRTIRAILDRILALPGALEELLDSLQARTDDDGVFYLRFDKQEAYQGRLELVRHDDVVQVRVKVMCHPATRDQALLELRRLLVT